MSVSDKVLSALVHPCPALSGRLQVPGDKSVSHRVAILAGLAKGTSRISNFLESEDCLQTLKAMAALGASVERDPERDVLHIKGTGGKLLEPAGALDLGNSGTSMRLLAGLLAAQPFTTELTGDESLRARPMKRIKDPLEKMGGRIQCTPPNQTAPLKIHGTALQPIDYVMPVASAQVKSCVLLAALYTEGTTTVVEPAPTRNHTERLLASAGINIGVEKLVIQVEGAGREGPRLAAREWEVPGDISSAAFLLLAAAAHPASSLAVERVGLNPRRTAFLNVLKRMGCNVTVTLSSEASAPEPFGTVEVQGGALKGTTVGGDEIPNLIDELPLVAVAGALAEGVTEIRDAAELRVKESDRITTMVGNLRAMGVEVEEKEDGMVIQGPARLSVPENGVRSYGDHRVAMAMAVLALFAPKPLNIYNIACVDTSYPGFWDDLVSLGGHVER